MAKFYVTFYYRLKTFLLVCILIEHALSYLVERTNTSGDAIYSVTETQCKSFSPHATWKNDKCQCPAYETFYGLLKESPKCYKEFGTNLGML